LGIGHFREEEELAGALGGFGITRLRERLGQQQRADHGRVEVVVGHVTAGKILGPGLGPTVWIRGFLERVARFIRRSLWIDVEGSGPSAGGILRVEHGGEAIGDGFMDSSS